MTAPVPKGKWAWKYDCCSWCGSVAKNGRGRHKARGLCLRCFDKKRGEKPKRKLNKREAGKRWRVRFKNNPNYKDIVNQKAREYRTTLGYRKSLKKAQVRNKFIYYLKKGKRFNIKRWKNGLEILIDGKRVKTPIKPPSANDRARTETTINEIETFKKVYAKLS